jgi:hypothetical protein
MDSEFPLDPNCALTLKPDLLPLDRVVLFADRSGAEAFLASVFPHFSHCLVASADRAFPRDSGLNLALFHALEQKEKIRVAVFQIEALKKVRLKTDRIFVMDDILMQDFKRHPADRALSLGFTPERVAFLLDAYFGQWDKMERIGNTAFAYSNFKEFKRDEFDWRAALLGIPDQVN